MADQHSDEGCGTSVVSGESSESTVELNIKTLESEIYTFHVDKNMPVSQFKEKIASEIGLPVGQQRLIFRGKVLKDDHLLSEYHVESGHTLHLVARQPSQSQPSPGTSSGETTANNNRGQDAGAGGPRNRIGTISHSVVLGTLNLADQGEGAVPDLSRVIGAVLNSLGMGNQTATGGVGVPQSTVQAPQGNETEGTQNNIGVQNQEGSQPPSGQAFFGQSLPHVSQMLPGTAVPVPSLNAPIPDSLNTLSEFMSRMELAFSQNGYEPNQSLPSADSPRVELPSNSRGLPTPEALGIVLRHAQHLFSDQAISALSRIAGRLEQEGSSTDPTIRGQIQTESMQVGLAMQHLGALLLELGRTILTLRMGQSPAESCVNAGPAVYISPSGPNPIMVQPFPLQTSSLFGGSAAAPLNPGTFGAAGLGHVPRHVNIHIHTAVGTRGSNGEGTQGERVNGARSGEPGQTLLVPVRNVIATAFPSQTAASASSATQSGVSVSQTPTESAPLSTVVAEVNSRIRNLVDNMQSENRATSGGNEGSNQPINHGVSGAGAGGQKTQPAFHESSSSEYASRSLDGDDNLEGATAVPLGLGMGSLQKKRSRLTRAESSSSGGGTSGVSHNQNQQILQTLASLANTRNPNTVPSGYPPPAIGPLGGQSVEGQFDASGIMSQLIQSPALNGLLAGVSEQSGVGSPDVLRNMLQQLTQNPAMRNTINQITQQVGSQDPGNMFPGIGGGQSGGFDLSRMVQQMMPIVSQALGNTSSIPRSVPGTGPQPWHSERRPVGDQNTNNRFAQIDLQQVVQRIQRQSPPGEIFHALVESVNSSGVEDLVAHLCQEGLDSAYMEILRRDVTHRFQGESESSEES